MDKLAARAADAITAWANRRRDFDEYLLRERLRVVEGEPGGAELKILQLDLREQVETQRADNARLRAQLDGRSNRLLRHAHVRLSRQIRAVTGSFKDPLVLNVVNDLLRERGAAVKRPEAFRRQRARSLKGPT